MAIPGCKSAFRAGFWPACYRNKTQIGLPAGLRPAGEPIWVPPNAGWPSPQSLLRDGEPDLSPITRACTPFWNASSEFPSARDQVE
jgi:hypothetical protein